MIAFIILLVCIALCSSVALGAYFYVNKTSMSENTPDEIPTQQTVIETKQSKADTKTVAAAQEEAPGGYLMFENRTSSISFPGQEGNVSTKPFTDYKTTIDKKPSECQEICNGIGSRCVGFEYDKGNKMCTFIVGQPGDSTDTLVFYDDNGQKAHLKNMYPKIGWTPWNTSHPNVSNIEGCNVVCSDSKLKCDGFYYAEKYFGAKNGVNGKTFLHTLCYPFQFTGSTSKDVYIKKQIDNKS